MATYIIAKYICEVDGEATDFVDYQVRYFHTATEEEALEQLKTTEPETYTNEEEQTVRWIFQETKAVEVDPPLDDGDELIGFVIEE